MIEEKKGEPEERNIKMVVEYDGTAYAGWQVQANGVTVQEKLERILSELACKKVHAIASGRTDAGVHALGQVFNVIGPFPVDNERLMQILNSRLPNDISIKFVEAVSMEFHSIRDAKWKRYRYYIYNNKMPSVWKARTSWFMPVEMDIGLMQSVAGELIGLHDFTSFKGKNSAAKTSERNIISSELRKEDDGMIVFEIVGEGFLKYMVRNIVGTLVDIGRGYLKPDDMKRILKAKDRTKAGVTAPPHGLFLVEVSY